MVPARARFAVEVDNWDEMLAHLDELGVAYSRWQAVMVRGGVGDNQSWGQRDDTGEHYTYIAEPLTSI